MTNPLNEGNLLKKISSYPRRIYFRPDHPFIFQQVLVFHHLKQGLPAMIFRKHSHMKHRYLVISGVPRVSRARGQSQFDRPHPVCSWQHRCEGWVGSKEASKAE